MSASTFSSAIKTLVCLENYQYEQTKLEKKCNPSTSPIMTVEYDVIESTVVPDPGARTRI